MPVFGTQSFPGGKDWLCPIFNAKAKCVVWLGYLKNKGKTFSERGGSCL